MLSAEPHLSKRLSFFGLAPKGVYNAIYVTIKAVGFYSTFSPLPFFMAVFFLLHFPWGLPRRLLTGFGVLVSPDFPPLKGDHTTV